MPLNTHGWAGESTRWFYPNPEFGQRTAAMSEELTQGMEAPDFDLATDGGGRIALASLRGHPAVVYFYPKDDTSGCTREAIAFTEHKDEFDRIGAAIVGISADPPAQHDAFKEKYDLGITLASDEDRDAIEAYGVWVEKNRYGRTYMGIQRATFLVDADGRIARIWRDVKVDGHAEQVLEAAKAL